MISANVEVAGVPSSNLVTSTAEIVVVVVEMSATWKASDI